MPLIASLISSAWLFLWLVLGALIAYASLTDDDYELNGQAYVAMSGTIFAPILICLIWGW
jgi:hypothetical protein